MTGADPGKLLILFALALNVLAGVAFLLVARGRKTYQSLATTSYHLFATCATLASAYLFYLFFTDNFAFRYVVEYSSSTQTFFYKLSAFWGGQAGTYLLWLLMNAAFGYIILFKAGRYRNYGMAAMTVVNLFLLSLLVKVSPFALMSFAVADGAGLNPLLQDPWMVVHPPVIFLGYSMAGVVFAIAIGAMLKGEYDEWARRVFPWVAVTALMLGAGNILGGYWAYKTLGWGGYWAWDPVENSSFIPWFVSLALLHGLVLERRTGAMRKINLLTTIFLFLLVVYGTFLTRSGVLADFSVHSFVDLGANAFLVGFMILFFVLAIVVFATRLSGMGHRPLEYNLYTRDFALFVGQSLLLVFSVIVLFWTSLPLLTTWFTSEPRAADVATYNDFAFPFAILYCLFLVFSPITSGRPFRPERWPVKLAGIAVVAIAAGVVFYLAVPAATLVFAVVVVLSVLTAGMYLMQPGAVGRSLPAIVAAFVALAVALWLGVDRPDYLMYLAVASAAAAANLTVVVRNFSQGLRVVGGQMAHAGFALMVIGVLGSSAFVTSEKIIMERGSSDDAFGVDFTYNGMENEITFPHNRLLLSLERDGSRVDARPELYFSERMNGMFKKPFIQKHLLYDLYLSPEQVQTLPGADGLVLTKNQPVTVGDYTLTFDEFLMDEHTDGEAGDIEVRARILASHISNPLETTLEPALILRPPEAEGPRLESIPVDLPGEAGHSIAIENILADRGAVVVTIPGLAEKGPEDRLIADVSRRPAINLVWLGTTIILLGGFVVYWRRHQEM